MTGWVPEPVLRESVRGESPEREFSLGESSLRESTGQFLRFAVVGMLAFLVDASVLQAALALGLDPYSGRVVSYLCAATAAWAMNCRYTFRVPGREGLAGQWLAYLAANAIGGFANYATYVAALWLFEMVRAWPVLGVGAGSVAGLAFNFVVNKYWVFRRAGLVQRDSG